MVDFRKGLLLLAVLLMASSLASAQAYTCSATANQPLVRAESLNDFVGDIVIECQGGAPTPFGEEVPRINFRIFLNTLVTSALLDDDWTESYLAIDDASSSDVNPLRGPYIPGNGTDDGDIDAFLRGVEDGNGTGINYADPWSGDNYCGDGDINVDACVDDAIFNVFQGELVDSNQIEWRGVPVDPPGTTTNRTIRIGNVRANGNNLGVALGFGISPVTVQISATGTTPFPLNQTQVTVGTVLKSMDFDVKEDSDFLQCEDEDNADDACAGDVLLKFSERFASAFKPKGPADNADVFGASGVLQSSESNYVNSALDDVFGDDAGLATQGTRLHAAFSSPSGVTLRVWEMEAYCGKNNSTAPAGFVEKANSDGEGGSASAASSWSDKDGVGSSATWEILDNPGGGATNDTLYFAVDVVYKSNTTAGIPALGTATVNGSYAPLSTKASAEEREDEPHPRFVDTSEAEDIFIINSCATNLLWPYVTAQEGFDTGMAISNTSLDPFGTATQEGACAINYYGNVSGGAPVPGAITTPAIPAGEQAVWLVSSGGSVSGPSVGGSGFAGVPGFQGYVIAQCAFQYAHGYAFVFSPDLSMAQGYLALVMDEAAETLPRSGSKSEPLSQ